MVLKIGGWLVGSRAGDQSNVQFIADHDMMPAFCAGSDGLVPVERLGDTMDRYRDFGSYVSFLIFEMLCFLVLISAQTYTVARAL